MGKNAVEVRDIHKKFRYSGHKNNSLKRAITQIFHKKDTTTEEFYALDGISFNVEKGDFFGILGRNGSGKSTLLKIIAEIYQPTSGSVKHDGKVVSFIELGVGFKSELTGKENVYLNGGLLGFSKKEVDAMYDDIVEFAELEKFMDQQLKNYSSGMKVRLAFSVAIRSHADILILDEVLAVGDAAFQKKCNDYFKTLKDGGKTVILVTHGMGAVREYCNKALVIEDGKILFEGDANEAADTYLKLFTPKNTKKVADKRFGTNEVKIKKVTSQIDKDYVWFSIDLLSQVDTYVYISVDISKNSQRIGGFSLKDSKTFIKCEKGSATKVSIPMKNILGGGVYSVTLSVKNSEDGNVYDFWRNVNEFNNEYVDSTYLPTVYPVNAGEIEVSKLGSVK